jgi:iron(III) transport system ATP-binding protein
VRDLLFDLVRHDNTSCLFVTHDATDALSIANKLGILRDGRLIQLDTPVSVYHQPLTAYAAQMTGIANIIKAKHLPLLGLPEVDNVDALFCLRPEQIRLDDAGRLGTVRAIYFKGSHYELEVELSRYVCLRMLTTRTNVQVGQQVSISVAEEAVWWLQR